MRERNSKIKAYLEDADQYGDWINVTVGTRFTASALKSNLVEIIKSSSQTLN